MSSGASLERFGERILFSYDYEDCAVTVLKTVKWTLIDNHDLYVKEKGRK